MKRLGNIATLLLTTGGIVGLMAGCGQKVSEKIAEKSIERSIKADAKKEGKDVDAKVDLDKGSMSIKGKDEEMNVGKGAKLPESFPKDVPVYPGAEVGMSFAQSDTYSVQLSTTDAMDKVAAYYKKELAANGWAEKQTLNQGGDNPMQTVSCEKSDRNLTVMIMGGKGKIDITLTTGK